MELEDIRVISYEKLMSFIRNYYYEKYHICISNEKLVRSKNVFSKDVMENKDIYFLFEYDTFNGHEMYTYGKLLGSEDIIEIIDYYIQNESLQVSEACFFVDRNNNLNRIAYSLKKIEQKQKVKE